MSDPPIRVQAAARNGQESFEIPSNGILGNKRHALIVERNIHIAFSWTAKR